MAQKTLTVSNDIFIRGSIDPMKPEFEKINDNFTELYGRLPQPPPTGTKVLTSTDGVVSWENAV